MNFADIKPSKTYYYPEPYKAQGKRSGSPKTRTFIPYRVMNIKQGDKTVFASANGAPPLWYNGNLYRTWITADEYKEQQKILL
jgi:hypothetical protein